MARLGRSYPVGRVFSPPPVFAAWAYTGPGSSGTTTTVSETDTVPANATCGLIWACHTSTTTPTVSASIGGTSASLVTTITAGVSGGVTLYLSCFSLLKPPTGSQTVSFTTTAGATSRFIDIDAVYYADVAGVGTPVSLQNQSGQPSISISPTGGANYMYANAFSYLAAAGGNTFSGYNQTQRYLVATVAGTNYPLLAGDAHGKNSSLTFSATRSDTTNGWGGIIVPLVP